MIYTYINVYNYVQYIVIYFNFCLFFCRIIARIQNCLPAKVRQRLNVQGTVVLVNEKINL